MTTSGETTPESVDEYLATLPEDRRMLLEKLRGVIRAAAPEATEIISYRMPTYKYRGRYLLGIAAWKDHIGLYAWNSPSLNAYREEIKKYKTSAGTIRFRFDEPLPVNLVKRIVRGRIAAIGESGRQKTGY
jgi:uncharacterized protein YdhG (YjbR/CyaY superfamily)